MSKKQPYLLAMKGHPATGKSMLAQALAHRLAWPLVDKDDVKDYLVEIPSNVLDSNSLSYDIMWRIVETQLRLGVSVIVDSPLSYPVSYETAKNLSQRYHAQLIVLETQIAEDVWKERLAKRGRVAADNHRIHSWASMQEQLRKYDGCFRYPIDVGRYIVVDTAQPVDELAGLVQRRIGVH
ncbi:MAG: AAA family ATPase [Chloroflexota bacterium]